jgi:hypothetical protein
VSLRPEKATGDDGAAMFSGEVSNADRARWALSALHGFVETTRVDTAQDAVTDLITNLLHLARSRGLDLDRIQSNAAGMLAQEIREDSDGDMTSIQRDFRSLLSLDR